MSEFSGDYDDRYAAKASQADKEARHRRAVAKIAEPLLDGLPQPGTHYFSPEQFRALVHFLFEGEPGKMRSALTRDRFKISALEFVCKRTKGETATISAFARENGIARMTLLDRAVRANLVSIPGIGKKLFYVEELNNLLTDAPG